MAISFSFIRSEHLPILPQRREVEASSFENSIPTVLVLELCAVCFLLLLRDVIATTKIMLEIVFIPCGDTGLVRLDVKGKNCAVVSSRCMMAAPFSERR